MFLIRIPKQRIISSYRRRDGVLKFVDEVVEFLAREIVGGGFANFRAKSGSVLLKSFEAFLEHACSGEQRFRGREAGLVEFPDGIFDPGWIIRRRHGQGAAVVVAAAASALRIASTRSLMLILPTWVHRTSPLEPNKRSVGISLTIPLTWPLSMDS